MYPLYWTTSKEGTYHFPGRFSLSYVLFYGCQTGFVTTCPGPLEVVSAARAVYIQDLSGKIQTGCQFRLQVAVNILKGNPASRDLRRFEILGPIDGKGQLGKVPRKLRQA